MRVGMFRKASLSRYEATETDLAVKAILLSAITDRDIAIAGLRSRNESLHGQVWFWMKKHAESLMLIKRIELSNIALMIKIDKMKKKHAKHK